MYSGSKKIPVLAALVFVICVATANAQSRIPADTLGKLIRNMAFDHVPLDEFNRVFRNFIRTTYSSRSSFFDYEVQDVTASFVYYIIGNNISEAWEKYIPPKPAPVPATPPPPPPPPKFPATHRLTNDLKLFASQDSGSTLLASLEKGTNIQVESWGEYAELDNIIAKWVKVKTESGLSGWLWSGYLEEVK